MFTPHSGNRPCRCITDGGRRMFVRPEGLWNDLMNRYTGLSKGTRLTAEELGRFIQPPLHDAVPPASGNRWVFPNYFILNDTFDSIAGLVSRTNAIYLLETNFLRLPPPQVPPQTQWSTY